MQQAFGIFLLSSVLYSSCAQLARRTQQQMPSSYPALSASGRSEAGQLNQTWRASAINSKYFKSTNKSTVIGQSTTPSPSILTHDSVSPNTSSHHYIVGCGNNRFNGDQGTQAFADFSTLCYLWNSSCPSQSTLERKNIQTILGLSYYHPCFGGGCQCMVDGTPAPAASTSSLASLVEFLRSPQCPVLFNSTGPCCGQYARSGCHFGLTAVDLYYWPVANANTSCLSIVGSDTTPLGEGATTVNRPYQRSSLVYWISTDVCRLDEAPWTTTEEVVYAKLTAVSGLTFKFYSNNPWERNEDCTPLTSTGLGAKASRIQGLTAIQTLRQNSMTAGLARDSSESSSSVVALDGLTFTSPSVYINFRGLQALDNCGTYGSSIGETMLAFDPGELSTVVGGGHGNGAPVLRPLNLADLPCPPQDVMEANWYKPAPGEPYIPRLAFPTRLSSLNPLWTTCEGNFFIGYDPPRTLVPVSAVDPLTTSAPSSTAKTSDGGDPDIVASPTPAPVSTPEVDQPEQTAKASVKPGLGLSDPSQPTLSPAQGDIPEQSSNSGDEADGTRSEVPDPGSVPIGVPLDIFNNPSIPSASHATPQDANGQPPITTIIAQHAATLLPPSIVIGTATLIQGGSPVTVSGTFVSLAPSGVVVASKIIPLPRSQQAIATIANSPLIYHPHAVAIAGDVLTPGALPKTLPGGAVVSIDSSGVVVASKPLSLPQSKPITTKMMGHGLTLLPHAIVISGITHTSGGSPITLSGMVMTIGPSSLSFGSQVIPFDQLYHVSAISTQDFVSDTAHTASGITLHGSRISVDSDGNLVIDQTTLTPGNPGITLGGTSISVAADHALVLDGTTLTAAGSSVTVAGMPVSENADGDLVIDGTTLLPGSDTLPVGSTPISVASNDEIIFDETTLKAGDHAATIGGVTISLAPNGHLVLDGTTLIPGSSGVTIDGRPFSVASDGNLVIDGNAMFPGSRTSSYGTRAMSLATNGHLLIEGTTLMPGGQGAILSGIMVSVAPDGGLVLAGTTLTPGGAVVTIDGRPISAAADGSIVIDGSTLRPGATFAAFGASTTVDGGLGALIYGAFGDRPTATSSTCNLPTALAFQGRATVASVQVFTIVMMVIASISVS